MTNCFFFSKVQISTSRNGWHKLSMYSGLSNLLKINSETGVSLIEVQHVREGICFYLQKNKDTTSTSQTSINSGRSHLIESDQCVAYPSFRKTNVLNCWSNEYPLRLERSDLAIEH